MRTICGLAVMAGVMGLAVPAIGLPVMSGAPAFTRLDLSWNGVQLIGDRHRGRTRRPVPDTTPRQPEPNSGDLGGYVVNRYGYGNYVAGPAGFGGYPAGSADAQIWKQRQEWKCQAVPERC